MDNAMRGEANLSIILTFIIDQSFNIRRKFFILKKSTETVYILLVLINRACSILTWHSPPLMGERGWGGGNKGGVLFPPRTSQRGSGSKMTYRSKWLQLSLSSFLK
jgi:hypothetical protein